VHRFAVFVTFCLLMVGAQLHAADVTLTWEANTEADLAGYRLYYGTASGHYDFVINVGMTTTYTVGGLDSGTYFFAVTAYNRFGMESGHSNEVSKNISFPATFYFPHSAHWATAGIGSENATSGVTVSSLDTLPVTVTFTAYGINGLPLSGDNIRNPVSMVLDPGAQVTFADSELFGAGLLSDHAIAYVEIATSNNRIVATLISVDGNAVMPGATPVEVSFTTYIFPEVKDGDPAWLGVANSNPVSTAALFQLLGAYGKVLRSAVRIIDPQSTYIAGTIAEVFPDINLSDLEYIRVIAGPGVVPCEMVKPLFILLNMWWVALGTPHSRL
jgi:hypothetical protein